MYHDLRLLHYLNIEYDASTFDTDPFEPQPDGLGTIFPRWIYDQENQKGFVELPYTLPSRLFGVRCPGREDDRFVEKNWIGL